MPKIVFDAELVEHGEINTAFLRLLGTGGVVGDQMAYGPRESLPGQEPCTVDWMKSAQGMDITNVVQIRGGDQIRALMRWNELGRGCHLPSNRHRMGPPVRRQSGKKFAAPRRQFMHHTGDDTG